MVVWFVAIAVLGVMGIRREPAVLGALNPIHGFYSSPTTGGSGSRYSALWYWP
jgi:K+ transporter